MIHPITGKYVDVIPALKNRKLDTHELAWAAGFFDGEGYTGSLVFNKHYKYCRLRIVVVQNGTYCLRRFRKAILGKGKIHSRGVSNALQIVSFEESQFVIALLWKYLSPTKKEQAILAIRKYHELNDNRQVFGD